jgi:hypothetical protein
LVVGHGADNSPLLRIVAQGICDLNEIKLRSLCRQVFCSSDTRKIAVVYDVPICSEEAYYEWFPTFADLIT